MSTLSYPAHEIVRVMMEPEFDKACDDGRIRMDGNLVPDKRRNRLLTIAGSPRSDWFDDDNWAARIDHDGKGDFSGIKPGDYAVGSRVGNDCRVVIVRFRRQW